MRAGSGGCRRLPRTHPSHLDTYPRGRWFRRRCRRGLAGRVSSTEEPGMSSMEMPEIDDFLPPSDPVEIIPTPEAESVIRERGGLLFIWPKVVRGLMANTTLLQASTEVPADALKYRRIEVGPILVFLS